LKPHYDTEYYKSKNIEPLNLLLDEFQLELRLCEFGMRVIMFYGGDEIGYWFQSNKFIELRYITVHSNYISTNSERHFSWESLCDSIKTNLKIKQTDYII